MVLLNYWILCPWICRVLFYASLEIFWAIISSDIFFFHSCPLSPFCQGLKRHTYHIFFLITDLGGSIHFYLFSLYSDWVISVVLSSKFIDSSTPFIFKFMSVHSYFDIYLNDKYLSSEIQETKPVTGHGGGSFPRTTEEFCLGEKLFSLMKYPIVLFFTLPMLHWLT